MRRCKGMAPNKVRLRVVQHRLLVISRPTPPPLGEHTRELDNRGVRMEIWLVGYHHQVIPLSAHNTDPSRVSSACTRQRESESFS